MSSSADVIVRCCVILVMLAYPVMCRVSAKLSYIPVCYRDNDAPGYIAAVSFYQCNNPLYSTCINSGSVYLCCGPDHECCQNGQSCCQKSERPWNVYEVVGVVSGITAWVGIFSVFIIFTLPRCIRAVRKRNRERKIAPKEDINKFEMAVSARKSRVLPTPVEESRSERRKQSQQEEYADVKRRMSQIDNRRMSQPETEDTKGHPRRPSREPEEGVKPPRRQAHLERVQELEKKAEKEKEEQAAQSRRPSKVDPSQLRRPSKAEPPQPRRPSKSTNQQRPTPEPGTSKPSQEPEVGINVQAPTPDSAASQKRPTSKSTVSGVPDDVDLA